MGTRSGDVDPGLHAFLAPPGGHEHRRHRHHAQQEVGHALGSAAPPTFMTSTASSVGDGDEAATLALAVYTHRLLSYIGSYIAILGGVEAITFTAGGREQPAAVGGD
ncbi:MAG: hypothetical protein R2742_11965 [Micropruina glycogenica]